MSKAPRRASRAVGLPGLGAWSRRVSGRRRSGSLTNAAQIPQRACAYDRRQGTQQGSLRDWAATRIKRVDRIRPYHLRGPTAPATLCASRTARCRLRTCRSRPDCSGGCREASLHQASRTGARCWVNPHMLHSAEDSPCLSPRSHGESWRSCPRPSVSNGWTDFLRFLPPRRRERTQPASRMSCSKSCASMGIRKLIARWKAAGAGRRKSVTYVTLPNSVQVHEDVPELDHVDQAGRDIFTKDVRLLQDRGDIGIVLRFP